MNFWNSSIMANRRNNLILIAVAALAAAAFLRAGADARPEEIAGFIPVDIGEEAPLLVQQHEVSEAEWAECVAARACPELPMNEEGNLPRTGVSWYDAADYIAWASERDGIDWRLPDFTEWMLIAAELAPAPPEKLFDAPELAWAASYDLSATTRARKLTPRSEAGTNSAGIAELTGPVWEWTSSCRSALEGKADTECSGARVAMGEHQAILAELTRDPAKAGCGAGKTLPYIGFRMVTGGREG